jgi:hypothetical protein
MEVEGVAELPGEANPLTEGLLFHTLKGTLTSDTQQLITSKQQLEQWEHKNGYYYLLLVRSAHGTCTLTQMTRHTNILTDHL